MESPKMRFKLGDYFIIGKYIQQPILWRCVAFHKIESEDQLFIKGIWDSIWEEPILEGSVNHDDGYAPLLVSDQILCYKVFDAPGNVLQGSHIKLKEAEKANNSPFASGSPIWGDSNIRCWLNSDKAEGEVEWLCGNPPTQEALSLWNDAYDSEPGFLHGFTPKEIGLMRSVSQETELPQDAYDDMSPYYREVVCSQVEGYFDHYKRPKSELQEDIATSEFLNLKLPAMEKEIEGKARTVEFYAERFIDKVFLLSYVQWKSLRRNRSVLGSDYHKAKKIVDDTNMETAMNEFMEMRNQVGFGVNMNMTRYMELENLLYYDGYNEYWLRSPDVWGSDWKDVPMCNLGVHIVNNGGDLIAVGPSADAVGIRPAFYLEDVAEDTFQGDGTIENPFILK